MFGICIGLALVGVIGLILQNHIVVRWLIEAALIGYCLYWGEKNFQLSKVIKKKLSR